MDGQSGDLFAKSVHHLVVSRDIVDSDKLFAFHLDVLEFLVLLLELSLDRIKLHASISEFCCRVVKLGLARCPSRFAAWRRRPSSV